MRRYIYTLVLVLALANTVNAASNVDEILQLYNEENSTDAIMNLEKAIKEKEYNDMLSSYGELEEQVESALNAISIYKLHVDQTIESAEKADDYKEVLPGVKEKDYYLKYELPAYLAGHAMSEQMYESVIKAMLPNYLTLETVKFNNGLIEKQYDLIKDKNLYGFQNMYNNYVIATKDYNIQVKELTILNKTLESLVLEKKQGNETDIEEQKLRNSIMLKEIEINGAEAQMKNLETSIRSLLSIKAIHTGKLPTEIINIKLYEPLGYEDFYKIVIKENIKWNQLIDTEDNLNQMNILVQDVYKENNLDGQILSLDIKKRNKELKKNMVEYEMLINQAHYNFEQQCSSFEIAEQVYMIAKKQWELVQINQDDFSETEYMTKEIDFLKEELKYNNSQNIYLKAYNNYLIWLSGGTPQQ